MAELTIGDAAPAFTLDERPGWQDRGRLVQRQSRRHGAESDGGAGVARSSP